MRCQPFLGTVFLLSSRIDVGLSPFRGALHPCRPLPLAASRDNYALDGRADWLVGRVVCEEDAARGGVRFYAMVGRTTSLINMPVRERMARRGHRAHAHTHAVPRPAAPWPMASAKR